MHLSVTFHLECHQYHWCLAQVIGAQCVSINHMVPILISTNKTKFKVTDVLSRFGLVTEISNALMG